MKWKIEEGGIEKEVKNVVIWKNKVWDKNRNDEIRRGNGIERIEKEIVRII